MNSGNLPALLLVGKQFGVYWIWPRHHVLTWFSVDHWSHKRLRGSMVRSVWETLCTSTTNTPAPPHTYIHLHSKVLRVLEVTRLSHRFYQIYLIIKSALGELKAAIQRQYAILEHINLSRFRLHMPLLDPTPCQSCANTFLGAPFIHSHSDPK